MTKLLDIFPETKDELTSYKVHCAIGRRDKKEPLVQLARNAFKDWQEYQNNKNFERKYILSLVYYRQNEWIYAGTYRRLGVKKDFDPERRKEYYRYSTELLDRHMDLIGRAIFTFRKDFRQSYVLLENHYQDIVLSEILRKPYRVAEFPGYENVLLPFVELKEIIAEEELTWKTALQNSKGIYLITDINKGKQYVGSAYGGEALWNRWASYAQNGHGNNRELRRVIENNGIDYADYFQFSILEIRSMVTDDQEVTNREVHWKRVLRTREFGYNDN